VPIFGWQSVLLTSKTSYIIVSCVHYDGTEGESMLMTQN